VADRNARRIVQGIAGFAISALAVWLTFRGKDVAGIWRAVRGCDGRYVVPAMLLLVAAHLVRTVRWGLLLEPIARVSFARLNAVCAVGFMAVLVLPFRLGELARPYLVADPPRLRVAAAMSTIVLERLADALAATLLVVTAAVVVPRGTPGAAVVQGAGVLALAAFALGVVLLAVAARSRDLAIRCVQRALGGVAPRLADPLARAVGALADGLHMLRDGKGLGRFFAWTAALWVLGALCVQATAMAFTIPLSAGQSLAIVGAVNVGMLIPAAPGMVGTFQAATVLGLALFHPGVDGDRAAAFANVLWAEQVVQQVVLGALFACSRHVRVQRVLEPPEEEARDPDLLARAGWKREAPRRPC
jgi:uncharacterized protein (TIRG00374 family)